MPSASVVTVVTTSPLPGVCSSTVAPGTGAASSPTSCTTPARPAWKLTVAVALPWWPAASVADTSSVLAPGRSSTSTSYCPSTTATSVPAPPLSDTTTCARGPPSLVAVPFSITRPRSRPAPSAGYSMATRGGCASVSRGSMLMEPQAVPPVVTVRVTVLVT